MISWVLPLLGLGQDLLPNKAFEDVDCRHDHPVSMSALELERVSNLLVQIPPHGAVHFDEQAFRAKKPTQKSGDLRAISRRVVYHPLITPEELKGMQDYFADGASVVYARSYGSYLKYFDSLGLDPRKLKGKRVLDLGSGLSPFVDRLSHMGVEATGVDLIFHPQFGYRGMKNASTTFYTGGAQGDPGTGDYNYYNQQAQRLGLNLKNRVGASITNLPFEDNSVDAITSLMVILYLPPSGQTAALQEMLRVLKPGGRAYIYTGTNRDFYAQLQARGIKMTDQFPGTYNGIFSFTKPGEPTQ